MAVADTSFIIAFFDRADAHHDDARERFEAADHVLLCTEVLVEVLGVIKARTDRRTANACLEVLMSLENLGWEESSDIMGAYRLTQKHPVLSFVDAAVIALARRVGEELLTYDVRQAAIAGGREAA